MEVNKIYNMDCLEGLKQLKDKSVDLVLTDPPYGINFVPQRETSKERHGSVPIANDELMGKSWVDWFTPISKECFRVLKDDSVAYFFSGFNPYYYYYVLLKSGFKIKANIIWVKNNFGLGYHFRRQYEQVLVAFKGNPCTPKKAMSDVIFERKVRGVALLHSCQKPVNVCEVLIKQYTQSNDIVLDPFMGSGTTAIACKQLNRRFIGFEISKEYCNIANKRLYKVPERLEDFF
jgi:site-specific DNA-methyltransferase (adenine-specific)